MSGAGHQTPEAGDRVESALRDLTVWDAPAPSPGLWERAASREAGGRGVWAVLGRPLPQPVLGGIAAALFIVLLAGVLLPSMGRARVAGVAVDARPAPEASPAVAYDAVAPSAAPARESAAETFHPVDGAAPMPARSGVPGDGAARAVVRKATMELRSADVRAAAAKAALLLNEAAGEYVQESSISGEGRGARAQLTLRVAADRLSEVLNQVRELGEVTRESITGQDVTAQVVDLEARLRNEQRVEAELLELLQKREDAPLADILQLRQSIASVRGEIERLTAQRDQLARMVSLGTVLLIIRGTDAPEKEAGAFSLLGTFGDRLAAAWRQGVRVLAGSVGFLVQVVVGGAVWWVLLGLGVGVWVRWARGRRGVV